ncbi:MAG: G5 domain-containing protein [Ruminococcus sp.]|nr:G5 domain-containing protein [Ruminococcus sp.]
MHSKMKFSKLAALLTAVCLLMGLLVACGGQEVTLEISDMGTKTQVTTSTDKTVKQTLEAAGISLGEKDETDPALQTKIAADTKEILVKRYAKVTVVYGDEKKEVEIVGGTVADAIKKAAFKTEENVTSDVSESSYLKDGMVINLVKGMLVELTVDGKTEEIAAKEGTVQDFLTDQKITLGEDDEVSEKLDAAITDGMKLVIKRVEYKEETKTEEIDYTTEERYSDSMAAGSSEVTQEGAKGEKEVTYKVKYVDGEEDSREAISEKITKAAVNRIVTYGSASNSGSDNSAGSYDPGTSSSSGSDGQGGDSPNEVYEVSRTQFPDCDGSGHGYYQIVYSDGHTEYVDY